jgi:hypothetical protein
MAADKRRVSAGAVQAGFALLVIAAASFIATFYPVGSDDHWWHMLTGRYLLEQGVVPVTDPFSFTFGGKPWVNWEWLSGLLMTVAWDRLGPRGLVLVRFVAVMTTALVLWWHHRSADPKGGAPSRTASLLIIGLALLVIFGRVSDRPHLLALPLLAATHLASTMAARRRHTSAVAIVFALIALWVLVHPSWLLGVLVHWAVVADDWIEHRTTTSRASWIHRLSYRGSPLLVLLPSLLMHPPTAYGSAVSQLFGSEGLTEWQPMTHYLQWDNFPLLAFLALTALWLASIVARRQQLARVITWLLATVVVGAFLFVRFTPLFAVLVAPPLHREASKRWPSATLRTSGLATVLIGLGLLLCLLETKLVFRQPFSATIDERSNPVAVAEFMKEHRLHGNVWSNGLNEQAYVAFRLYPDVRVFIDGRVPQLFPESHLRVHSDATNSPDAFRRVLNEYPIEHVVLMEMLTERPTQLAAMLAASGDFALMHFDDHTMLWSRKTALQRLPSPPPAYAYLIPPLIGDTWFEAALKPERFATVVDELGRLLTDQPRSRIGLALGQTLAQHPAATPEQRAAVGALLAR